LLEPFGPPVWFQVLFVLTFIVVIFVTIVRVLTMRKGEMGSGVVKEREVIREIVKIRCRYCGQLYEEKLDRCPHCGGKNA